MARTYRAPQYDPDRIKGCKARTRADMKRETVKIVNEEMN